MGEILDDDVIIQNVISKRNGSEFHLSLPKGAQRITKAEKDEYNAYENRFVSMEPRFTIIGTQDEFRAIILKKGMAENLPLPLSPNKFGITYHIRGDS